jgi:1-acyl-sn-glycerol-3-phosphate acyltransferase
MTPPEKSQQRRDGARPRLVQRACLALLRLFRWRVVSAPLPGPRGVIIVYPHTSNWDFIVAVLFRFGTGLQASWMGKDSLFRWPLRGLLLRMGGVPINRRQASGFIDAAVQQYRTRDAMWLALTPEGTRARTDHLKSGFYQIALGADVPCGLGFIDYPSRTLGIARFVRFSGEVEQDLGLLRAFYADKRGRFPERAGEIRFREAGRIT